jgi:hypothetical protein
LDGHDLRQLPLVERNPAQSAASTRY